MSAPHTPGPWSYDPCVTIHGEDHLPCVVDEHRLVVAQAQDDGHTEEECEANARLIAAAPELLEAFVKLVKRTPFLPTANGIALQLTFEQMAEHKALLAKATGAA